MQMQDTTKNDILFFINNDFLFPHWRTILDFDPFDDQKKCVDDHHKHFTIKTDFCLNKTDYFCLSMITGTWDT